MVKANAGTVGITAEGCAELSQIVNVFVSETRWAELGPKGAVGCCSAMVYWNPRIDLALWELLRNRDWAALDRALQPISQLHGFLAEEFAPRGFTDTAFDRMGGLTTGFLRTSLKNRGPYPSATAADVALLRAWCRDHFPELLAL